MAIRAGQLVLTHDGELLLERVQNANGQLNVPTEVIKELGNPKSVATIRDTPDLTYSLQSFDATTAVEQWLTGITIAGASGADLVNVQGRNLITQLRSGNGTTAADNVINGSFIAPAVLPERISYRFAVQDNSTMDISLRGDAQFINPGPAYVSSAMGTGASGQTIVLGHVAGAYSDSSGTHRALAVVCNGQRLTPDVDYTETLSGSGSYRTVTVHLSVAYATTEEIEVLYFSNVPVSVASEDFDPDSNDYPAALRGKSVQVYIGGAGYDPDDVPGSQALRWTGVRSATAEWAQTVTSDYELGNAFAYDRSADDVPTVTGTITIRPSDKDALFARLRTITGKGADESIGADSAVPLPLDLVLKAADGSTLKRIHVPDARFTIPGINGQVGNKTDFDLAYTSDGGTLEVFAE